MVDGGKGIGIQANAGTCEIGMNARVKAAIAYNTVRVAEDGVASIEVTTTDINEEGKQEITGDSVYTCRRANDGELYLTKAWKNYGIRAALEMAEDGEIVTMRADSNIGTESGNGQKISLDIKSGTEANPVELDLNGKRFTVSDLNVGLEGTAAFRIFNTDDTVKDIMVRGLGFRIGQDSCLILENSVYGENPDRASALIENGGSLYIQRGATLTASPKYSLLDLLAGSTTVIGGDGSTVTLSSEYGGNAEEALIRMQEDASLTLNNCEIDGSNVNALYVDGSDAKIEINDSALITSKCSTGTVYFEGLNENVAYNGGIIRNDSDGPAIFWNSDGDSDGMPQLPDEFGTKIGSKSEKILVWNKSAGTDEANLGYSVIGPEDGYYYISAEDPEIQRMLYLATPSQLDEIADGDLWFDDDIIDEDEEYMNPASPSNASPSNASCGEDDDGDNDYDDYSGYEENAVKETVPGAREPSVQEPEIAGEPESALSVKITKDAKTDSGESEKEKTGVAGQNEEGRGKEEQSKEEQEKEEQRKEGQNEEEQDEGGQDETTDNAMMSVRKEEDA